MLGLGIGEAAFCLTLLRASGDKTNQQVWEEEDDKKKKQVPSTPAR